MENINVKVGEDSQEVIVFIDGTKGDSGGLAGSQNVGSGAGVFKQTTVAGISEFKSLNALSNKISITGNTNTIDIDVNQSNLTISESQVTGLTSDLNTLSTAISTLAGSLTGINNHLSTLDTQIANINSQLTTINGNISTLSTRVTANETAIININNQISTINGQITTIQSTLSNKVDKVSGKGLSTEDFTTAEKTKLANIASGATANQTDAYLLSRANHTGSQLASTISDFNTSADARISAAHLDDLIDVNTSGATNNQVLSYDNTTSTWIPKTVTSGGTGNGDMLKSVYDTNNNGNVDTSDNSLLLQGQNSAYHLNRTNHTGTQLAATISDFTNAAKTAVVDNSITSGVTDKAPSESAVFNALANKVDKVSGKGLSTEDYTTTEKTKLAGLTNYGIANSTTLGVLKPDNTTFTVDTFGFASVIPLGNGNSSNVNANIVHGTDFNTQDANYGGYTAGIPIKGNQIINLATKWKFYATVYTSNPTILIGNITIAKTLAGDPTVISTTNVSVGGSFNPVITSTGAGLATQFISDTINLPIDSFHDYYILVYFSNQSNLNVGLKSTSNDTSLLGYYASGDQTSTTNVSVFTRLLPLLISKVLVVEGPLTVGTGDMLKSTYDTNSNGIVDNSELLQGQNSAYHLNRTNHTGTQLASTISNFNTSVDSRISAAHLDDLVDVNTSGATNGQSLVYDLASNTWIPNTITSGAPVLDFLQSKYKVIAPRGGFNKGTGELDNINTNFSLGYGIGGFVIDPRGQYLYVANNNANNIFKYSIDSYTGKLTSVGSLPSTGSSPLGVAIDPFGRFLFVANNGGDSISAYTVAESDGTLTSVGSATSLGSGAAPTQLVCDATGKYLYVVNSGTNTVGMFYYNKATGVLTSIGTAIATGSSPYAICTDPTGKFVYVTNNGSSDIYQYSINSATGALTNIGTISCGSVPLSIDIDPTGRFVYVSNYSSTTISMYILDPVTGVLSTTGAGTITTFGTNSQDLKCDPSGRFLYLANTSFSFVSAYSINQFNGNLTYISSYNSSGANNTKFLLIDPSGRFIYTYNNSTANISTYSINNFQAGSGGFAGTFTANNGATFKNNIINLPKLTTPTYVQGGMYYDNSTNKLTIGGATAWETVGGSSNLSGLNDVNVTGVTNGQVLTYNTSTSKWIASTLTSGDMLKSVYDTNNNGNVDIADNSLLLQGQNSAYHLNRTNHTGTQLAATISDFTSASKTAVVDNSITSGVTDKAPSENAVFNALSNKVDKVSGKGLSTEDYTTAEKTKLAGIASGATANQTDAYLLSRANHTGSQLASTISDFNTSADARISAAHLDDLIDVNTSGATNGQALTYNLVSNTWVPSTITSSSSASIIVPSKSRSQGTGDLSSISNTSTPSSSYALCSEINGKFVYVANNGANSISKFLINANGSLSVISAATASGSNPQAICTDPTGKFLYSANNGSDDISMFTIDQVTGDLTSIGSNISSGTSSFPRGIACEPSGKYVYVTNSNLDTVSMFSINQSTGALTSIGSAVSSGSSGDTPFAISCDPTGRFVYVCNLSASTIKIFNINQSTGVLINVGSISTSGSSPRTLTVDVSGKYIYVLNSSSNTIVTFLINQTTGALSIVGTAMTIPSGSTPYGIVCEPSGKYLYIASYGSSYVNIFGINNVNGTLKFVNNISTSTGPYGITCDSFGRFIFTSSLGSSFVSGFAINTLQAGSGSFAGLLTAYAGATVTGGLFNLPKLTTPTYVQGGLYYDNTTNKLTFGGATAWETLGGSTTLSGLTDVNTSGVINGKVLTYDSTTSKWIPGTPVVNPNALVKMTTLDLGNNPKFYQEVTITDVDVLSTSKILSILYQPKLSVVSTSIVESADDDQFDLLQFTVKSISTGFFVLGVSSRNEIQGRKTIQYVLGTVLTAYSSGDMVKSVYDTTNNGNVDTADNSLLLQGQNSAYHLSRTNHTGTQLSSTISDFNSASNARIALTNLGTLANLNIAGVTDGQFLYYDAATTKWKAKAQFVGLVNFTESVNNTSPNASVPVVQLIPNNAATNVDVSLAVKGTGSLLVQIPDLTATGGSKRGTNAVDLQMGRTNAANVASGTNAVISGGYDNKANGTYSAVSGGNTNFSIGNYSYIGGGNLNSSGDYDAIGGGYLNSITTSYGFIGGGWGNSISGGNLSAILGGQFNTVTLNLGTVLGGKYNKIDANGAIAMGQNAWNKGVANCFVHGSPDSNNPSVASGGNQYGRYILYGIGTNTSNIMTPSIILQNNEVRSFVGNIIIKNAGLTNVAGFRFDGVITRGANSAATTLVSSSITGIGSTTGATTAGYGITLAADTTSGGLLVSVTQMASGTSVSAVATIHMTELIG